MEMKQLTYFVTVVQMGNISSAAKKLHMSQPPLSLQMRLLEEELGTVLFERGARRIVLTECGKLFYERARAILNLAQYAQEEVADFSTGVKGVLRIGLISSASQYFIQEIADGFRKEWESIRFEFTEANTYRLLELLEENALEIAVVRTPFAPAGFEGIELKKDAMVAVGVSEMFQGIREQKEHGKHELGRISLKELSGRPLVIYRRWEDVLYPAFSKERSVMNVYCKTDDARTTLTCTQIGLGIGIMPASIVPSKLREDMVQYEIACKELESSMILIHAKDKKLSRSAEALIEYVKEQKKVTKKTMREVEKLV